MHNHSLSTWNLDQIRKLHGGPVKGWLQVLLVWISAISRHWYLRGASRSSLVAGSEAAARVVLKLAQETWALLDAASEQASSVLGVEELFSTSLLEGVAATAQKAEPAILTAAVSAALEAIPRLEEDVSHCCVHPTAILRLEKNLETPLYWY